jgi:hypothetical protein
MDWEFTIGKYELSMRESGAQAFECLYVDIVVLKSNVLKLRRRECCVSQPVRRNSVQNEGGKDAIHFNTMLLVL